MFVLAFHADLSVVFYDELHLRAVGNLKILEPIWTKKIKSRVSNVMHLRWKDILFINEILKGRIKWWKYILLIPIFSVTFLMKNYEFGNK